MEQSWEEQFDELMEQSYDLPYGDTKTALIEEAIRLADLHQDVDAAFHARSEHISAAFHSGRAEKGILSFAWCLAQCDQNPDMYNERQMMWQYKWVAEHIDQFPQISAEKIDETLEDFKKRYEHHGYSLRAYYKLKQSIARRKGSAAEAYQYYEQWLHARKDGSQDCHACELHDQAEYLLEREEFFEAYRIAQMIIQGKKGCLSVPHSTYACFLLPLLEEGRWEEAADFQRKGYQLIHNKRDFLGSFGEHIKYMTVVNRDKAVSYLEKHLPEAIATFEMNPKFNFYLAASILFEQLGEQASVVVHLPESVTPEWVNEQLYEIACQFDQRNGNNHYTQQIERERICVQALKAKMEKEINKEAKRELDQLDE